MFYLAWRAATYVSRFSHLYARLQEARNIPCREIQHARAERQALASCALLRPCIKPVEYQGRFAVRESSKLRKRNQSDAALLSARHREGFATTRASNCETSAETLIISGGCNFVT